MLAIAWALIVGAAGFGAANLASGAALLEVDSVRGLFFFGPLGSLIGFIAAEWLWKPAGGFGGRWLGWMLLVTVLYGALVFVGVKTLS